MPDKGVSGNRRKADELFDLVKIGDQKAFDQLFAIFFARLNDFAGRVVKDNMVSQDIVQEAFVKLWENRRNIESLNLESFLFLLVRNRCLDYLKHLKVVQNRMQRIVVESKYEELYRIDFVGDEPYLLIEQELEHRIQNTIRQLPDKCRDVFILSRLQGLKNREIADQLQISIKNVERHLKRALSSFQKDFSNGIPLPIIILLLKNL